MADHLQTKILTPLLVERVVSEIKAEVDRQLAHPPDADGLEAELRELRSQSRNLVKMGRLAGDSDIPELAAELRRVNDRIRNVEVELRTAQRMPEQVRDLMAKVETTARAKLDDLRTALAGDREGAREVYKTLFLERLTFHPVEVDGKGKGKRAFAVQGKAALCKLSNVPNGI